MTLREILKFYNIDGRDKPGGTDKDSIHSYIEVYEKYLAPYVDKDCSLLEIGVWHGGSALLWQQYLQKCKICAIDIDNLIADEIVRGFNDRFRFYQANAYNDATTWLVKTNYPEGFDIIIEDGIHTKESNEFAIKNYLPMLKKGGVMIIEDLPANPLDETPFAFTGITLPHVIEEMKALIPEDYDVEVIDLTHVKGRFDDILMVIKYPL